MLISILYTMHHKKKGSPVHVAPACAGSGEGSDHLGSFCTQPSPAFLQEAGTRNSHSIVEIKSFAHEGRGARNVTGNPVTGCTNDKLSACNA